jgi:hypothetical protein
MNQDTGEIRQMSMAEVDRRNEEAGQQVWVPVPYSRVPRIKARKAHNPSKPKNADYRHMPRSERKKFNSGSTS